MAIGPGAMASNMKSAHEWPKFPPLMSQIIGIIGAGSVISGLLLANDMHMRAAIAGCAGSGNNLGVLDSDGESLLEPRFAMENQLSCIPR